MRITSYLSNVDLLDLQVIEDIREGLEGNELASADVLLALGVEDQHGKEFMR